MSYSPILLTGGNVQGANNVVVPFGSLVLVPNQNFTVNTSVGRAVVSASIQIVYQFDADGNLITPCPIWSGADTNPPGIYYIVAFRDQYGTTILDTLWQLTEGSGTTVDIGTINPFTPSGGSSSPPVVIADANYFYAGPYSGSPAPASFRTIGINDLFGGTGASSGTFLRGDGSWHSAGAGSVTSVGLVGDTGGIITISGSPNPITAAGTFTLVFASETQSTFLAAPSDSSGTPTFRTISYADLGGLNAPGSSPWMPIIAVGSFEDSTNLQGESFIWQLPASFLVSPCNSWQIGISFCGTTDNGDETNGVEIGGMVVYQFLAGVYSGVPVSTTTVTFQSNPTPTLGGTSSFLMLTDAIALPVTSTYDYYFAVFFVNTGKVTLPRMNMTLDTTNWPWQTYGRGDNQLANWAASGGLPISDIQSNNVIYAAPFARIVS